MEPEGSLPCSRKPTIGPYPVRPIDPYLPIIIIIIIIIYSSFAPQGAQGFDSASPSEASVSVSWIH
jgi:hypothetical protein